MTERFVLIESNTSGTGRHFAAAARRLGLHPLLFAEDPSRYPYAAQDGVETVRHPCGADPAGLAARIRALEAPVAGVSSSSDYFVETAAEIARGLGLPGPDPEAVRTCRDKWRQRLALRAAGVPVPAFARACTRDEAVAALDAIPPPVVLKPTSGTGSRGVRLCADVDAVAAHAEALLSVRANERGQPVPAELLVEEFVPWPEFSAELFGTEVIGITRKHVSRPPYFVEEGHDFPAAFTPERVEYLTATLQAALRAVGAGWGPTHTEFRYDGRRFAIVEINPRLAGGFIPELVRLASGIDAVTATVALAAGRDPRLRPDRRRHASVRFVCPGAAGRIGGFRGLERAAAVEGVVDVQTYREPGEEHEIRHDFRDRVGHVIACADTEGAAAAAAERGAALVDVVLEPASVLAR